MLILKVMLVKCVFIRIGRIYVWMHNKENSNLGSVVKFGSSVKCVFFGRLDS